MSKTKRHSKVIHSVVALLVVALALVLSSSPAPMLASPAPIVDSVTATAFGSDTTDHYVAMPATVDAGNLLIVLFTNDGDATVTTPGDWNPLASDTSGVHVRLSVYYKTAAGTEGGTTVNFVTSASEEAAAQVYQITYWNDTTPPEISTVATGTDTAPNPSSLNPAGWDVADTLWLAVAGQDRGDRGIPTYPVSYTDGVSTLSSDGTKNCRTLSARRALVAASENPGAFTIPASEQWVAFTIAVRPGQYDLTTSSTAGGSVTTPGEGVFSYDEGATADLVATPDEGYRFVNWTGDVGTIDDVYAAETTINMNADYSIIAEFVAIYDLTLSSTAGGSVTEPGEGVYTYDVGTVVALIAEADACYEFINWTGDVGTIDDVYDASTNITMDAAKNVTANFALLSHNLTTDSTDGGSVTDPGEGTFTYDCGTVVDLVATPDEGYRFDEWTGDVGTIADVYAASTNITVNGAYSITATFVVIYDLTISSTAGGSVTEPGEDTFTYDEGTVVDLVAEADACYEFINWTGDVSTIADVNAAATNITMDDDYSITANFALLSYNLTTDSTDGGSVTDPGEGTFTYDCGTVVNLVAVADEGYRFDEWTGDVGTIADVYAAATNITMNGDYSITAEFVRQYDLTTSSTAGGSVTTPGEDTFTYDEGTVVDLVATPDEGYRFGEWTGDVGTIANIHAAATNITMDGDYSIIANFIAQYDLTIDSTVGGNVTTPGEGVFPDYDTGKVVDLVATPDEDYRFDEWTGDVGTIDDIHAAATNITMNGDYSITANFIRQYDLTTSSTAGGSVTTPGEDTFTYDEGTVVDLVATPDEGYRFDEWTGDIGTIADVYAAATNITMDGDYSITAEFVRQYDLTTSSTAGGSVTEPGEGVYTYDEGTVVDLVATPDEGYRFDEWTGDIGTIDDVHATATNITMTGDYSITAEFVRQYDLTTSSTAGGSVTEPGEDTFTYDEGTVVDLVATPDEGYRFDEWTGDIGTIDDVHAVATNITMDGDYEITANFIAQYDLTIDSTVGGNVTTPGEGLFPDYDAGTVVDLVATPDAEYRFVEWTGDVSTIANVHAASTNITMDGDYSITAEFVRQYDLTTSSTAGGSVTTPGEDTFTYDEGTVVDLVATPDEGYRFDEWTGDIGTIDDVHAVATNITMNGDYSITAEFVRQYDLTTSSTSGGSVTTPGEGVYTYDEGTVVDLVATPDAEYRFVEWTGDVGTVADIHAASTNTTMAGDYSITAEFVRQYDLITSSTEGGSVTTPGEDTFTYDEGTLVDLLAVADEGYRFVEWTGDVDTITNVHAAATNITMNGDYSITANFVRQYDLTTSSTEGGSVTEPGEGVYTYDETTVVDLVAETNACYEFLNWTGDVGTIADVNAAATNITMNSSYNITANFALLSYNLTVDSTDGGSVTDPGEGMFTYDCGTVVDLVTVADEGYRFDEWTGDVGTVASVHAAATNITMGGDYSITAEFVAIYDLTMAADPEAGGTATDLTNESPYAEGTEVSIKAEAAEGYEFVNWTAPAGGFDDASAPETIFTMPAQNVTVTANFEEIPPSPEDPTVTTQAAASINTNSANLNMSYTLGDFNPVEVCFAYKESTASTWSSTDWVSKEADGTHAESLTGLDSDTEYDFKAQLKYEDTVIEGTTLQFTTDTSSPPPPSQGCFIATAAYGTPTAEQIDVLREFRDNVLLENIVGSQFVALYYQLSPPVADFISESSFLRTLVRELLVDPIVWVVSTTGDIWQN